MTTLKGRAHIEDISGIFFQGSAEYNQTVIVGEGPRNYKRKLNHRNNHSDNVG